MIYNSLKRCMYMYMGVFDYCINYCINCHKNSHLLIIKLWCYCTKAQFVQSDLYLHHQIAYIYLYMYLQYQMPYTCDSF